MKTLLIALFLSIASMASAQEKVLLDSTVLIYEPEIHYLITHEDGWGGWLTAGHENKLWYVGYILPRITPPDSITFVVSNSCEFVVYSSWNAGNHMLLSTIKERSEVFREVTVKYAYNREIFAVGVSVSGLIDGGKRQQSGQLGIDAAYAWYPTPKSRVAVANPDSLLKAEEAAARAHVAIHPEKWYTTLGARYITATSSELEAANITIKLFGYEGLWWDPENKIICFRKNCIIDPEAIR